MQAKSIRQPHEYDEKIVVSFVLFLRLIHKDRSRDVRLTWLTSPSRRSCPIDSTIRSVQSHCGRLGARHGSISEF